MLSQPSWSSEGSTRRERERERVTEERDRKRETVTEKEGNINRVRWGGGEKREIERE